MLDVLARKPLPEWLVSATTDRPVPWFELLDESLYYAACGTDGRPVQYLGCYCHSFIYADYGYSFTKISELLNQDGAFWGYQLHSSRLVDVSEIDLITAWQTIHLDTRVDGEPNRYRERQVPPYAYWCIFKRLSGMPDEHGPENFSLLYLGMDGVAAFHALYVLRQVVPSVIAIIQPGEGFGLNWTHFHDARQIFCRTVLGNPAGAPEYLLLGGYQAGRRFQESVVWPEYGSQVKFWKVSEGYFGLWQHI
jgi:hypothetical protein